MSKSNAFELDLVSLIFLGTAIANLADNTASGPLTSLYLSLHTADPGEAGNQSTSECTYGGYVRVAVARDGTAWTVAGNSATLIADTDFVRATSGSETATHFGIGTAASGAGKLLYSGTITPTISISAGIKPRLLTGTVVTED